MSKRDEYVERAKKRLDDWNSDIKKLEDAYEKAESGARLRLNEQIESLRRHREAVQEQIQRIEDAAEEVWHEIARGAEEAWRLIGDSFARHRSSEREKPEQEKSSEEKPSARTSHSKKATAKKSPKKSSAKSA